MSLCSVHVPHGFCGRCPCKEVVPVSRADIYGIRPRSVAQASPLPAALIDVCLLVLDQLAFVLVDVQPQFFSPCLLHHSLVETLYCDFVSTSLRVFFLLVRPSILSHDTALQICVLWKGFPHSISLVATFCSRSVSSNPGMHIPSITQCHRQSFAGARTQRSWMKNSSNALSRNAKGEKGQSLRLRHLVFPCMAIPEELRQAGERGA